MVEYCLTQVLFSVAYKKDRDFEENLKHFERQMQALHRCCLAEDSGCCSRGPKGRKLGGLRF